MIAVSAVSFLEPSPTAELSESLIAVAGAAQDLGIRPAAADVVADYLVPVDRARDAEDA